MLLLLLLPTFLFGSMLSDAEKIGQKYAIQTAKLPSPSSSQQPNLLLQKTSNWLSIDLNTLSIPNNQTAFQMLNQESFWKIIQDLGIDGLYFKNLKEGGALRKGFGIDPKWGNDWNHFAASAHMRGITLIGDLLGSAIANGSDFALGLQNKENYIDLFHLVEIDSKDWDLLPAIPVGRQYANIPWLNLEDLVKKGYITKDSLPYVKESNWNATGKIRGIDGVTRRWIYLKEKENDPVLSWLSPSLSSQKLTTSDALKSIYELHENVFFLDANLPFQTKDFEALWIRKIGGFSVQKNKGTLAEMKASKISDLILDVPTRGALLHALIAGDTEALRLIYKLYIQEKIDVRRLVHALEPFDRYVCDWAEFSQNRKKKYQYREEKITGEVLRNQLLKEDLIRLQGGAIPLSTWGRCCELAMNIADQREEVQKAHLLLAFTYAMQPGVFSISSDDLVGALSSEQTIDLLGFNEGSLYPSLTNQMQTPRSFASQFAKILSTRTSSLITMGKLTAVPPVTNKGTLLLLHELEGGLCHLLAVNFSKSPVQEKIEIPQIQQTWAIDLMSGLSQNKEFDQGIFFFDLPPLSGKAFLFQPRHYN